MEEERMTQTTESNEHCDAAVALVMRALAATDPNETRELIEQSADAFVNLVRALARQHKAPH